MHEGFLEHSKPEGFKKTNNNTTSANTTHVKVDNNQRPAHKTSITSSLSSVNNKQQNGSVKSASDSRNDEIHRQATIRGLERRSRKLSQKLSETSLYTPYRKNGQMVSPNGDRESFMW
jgi:hypothetical protein